MISRILSRELPMVEEYMWWRNKKRFPPQKYIKNSSAYGTAPTELLNTRRYPQTSKMAKDKGKIKQKIKIKEKREKVLGQGSMPKERNRVKEEKASTFENLSR